MTVERRGLVPAARLPGAAAVFLGAAVLQVLGLALSPLKAIFVKYLVITFDAEPELLAGLSPLYLDLHLLVRAVGLPPVATILALQITAWSLAITALYVALSLSFRRGAALLAAALTALAPGSFLLVREMEPEAFVFSATCIAFLGLLAAVRGEGPWRAALLLASLALMASVALRPSAALLAGAAGLLVLTAGAGRRRAVFALLLTGPLLACLWLAVRGRVYPQHAAKLGPMDPAGVFFGANNPLSDGTLTDSPVVKEIEIEVPGRADYGHVVWAQVPRAQLGASAPSAEVASYWFRPALAWISDEPVAFLRLLATKARFLFSSYEVYDLSPMLAAERDLRRIGFPLVPIALLAGLGAGGLLWARPPGTATGLALLGILSQAVVSLVFYVSARHRLPVLPFVAFFAAAAIAAVLEAVRRRGEPAPPLTRRAGWVALTSLAATLFFHAPFRATQDHERTVDVLNEAGTLRREALRLRDLGDMEGARRAVAACTSAAGFDAERCFPARIPYDGLVFTAASSPVDELLRDLALDRPAANLPSGVSNLAFRAQFASACPETGEARLALRNRSFEEAATLAGRALERRPGDPYALATLSAAHAASGEVLLGARAESLLVRYYDTIDADLLIATAERTVSPRSAAVRFERLTGHFPRFRRAHLGAAASLGRLGHLDAAMSHLGRASALAESPLLYRGDILNVLRQYAAVCPPASPVEHAGLARLFRVWGEPHEAALHVEAALRLDPAFRPALRELEALSR